MKWKGGESHAEKEFAYKRNGKVYCQDGNKGCEY